MSTCLGFLLVECDGAASNSTPLSTVGKTKHYKADVLLQSLMPGVFVNCQGPAHPG